MQDSEKIRKTEEFLKEKFDGALYLNSHPNAKAYRLEHSYRVANIARQIAEKEGLDATEAAIAGLLHDVAYCEEFDENGWKEHGRRSAHISRPFLEGLGIAGDRIADICYGIAIHVDDESDFAGERTAFALSIGDADNIDRFDVYRIHESLCGDGFLEMRYEEKLEYTEARLARLRKLKNLPMATATARELWSERLSFYITFYEKLAAQLKCSKSITD